MAANISEAAGGGIVANGVVTYLPQCSTLDYSDVLLANAKDFDLTDSSYFVRLIPSAVPGLLFGTIALLAFLFWSIWLCMQCRCRRRQGQQSAAAEQARFVASSQGKDVECVPQHALQSLRGRSAFCYKALLVAMALALAGVGAWGLAGSIAATNDTFTELWDIVQAVNDKVDTAAGDLELLQQQLTELSGNVSMVSDKAPEVLELFDSAVGLLNSTDLAAAGDAGNATAARDGVAAAVESIFELPSSLESLNTSIKGAVSLLRENFNDTIADIRSSFYGPSMAVEDTWRFVLIGAVFGATILIALVCAATFWSLHWYRCSVLALVLLWLDITVLMWLGVGLLRSVSVVTSDACLYGEYFSIQLAQRKVAESQRDRVLNMFDYFYGLESIPDDMVVNELLGVPTYLLHEVAYGPLLVVAAKVLELGRTPAVAGLLAVARLDGRNCPGCIASLSNITAMLPSISTTVKQLEQQALKSSIDPLYDQIKSYLCCTLSSETSSLWVAWTCAGVIGFVLAVLCSARMVHHTTDMRRFHRMLAAAAAAAGGDAHWAAPIAAKRGGAAAQGGSGLAKQVPGLKPAAAERYQDVEIAVAADGGVAAADASPAASDSAPAQTTSRQRPWSQLWGRRT
ncbi:hypothetical protein D9Q98_009306 [Chlorella vulgaris]|uniref:Uncharacterized protein n=1 Tax=Chlorella vulgaris TaxID=3077 RepID=A0A9D4TP77_CHLVU|nr:hypothetical protein D9Q98_009306 [Chlorella vulgaris]